SIIEGAEDKQLFFYEKSAEEGKRTVSISEIKDGSVRVKESALPESVSGVIIRSSTSGSTKKFKLTVDDSGTISATEVV
ncbi:MAG: hypothetical protein IIU70_02945, partial [Anaerotignum sp.]|nr:hypothetical protein [Anaerotignum sp.]